MANKNERNHESTWGLSEEQKAAWDKQNGDTARKDAERRNEATAKGEKDA